MNIIKEIRESWGWVGIQPEEFNSSKAGIHRRKIPLHCYNSLFLLDLTMGVFLELHASTSFFSFLGKTPSINSADAIFKTAFFPA